MSTDGKTLEHTVLDNLATFLSPDKLQALLVRYIDDSENILHHLDDALQNDNAEEATRLVHSLKSTSANVGAIQISELARTLESLAREQKLDDVRQQTNQLSELFDVTRVAIQQLDLMKG